MDNRNMEADKLPNHSVTPLWLAVLAFLIALVFGAMTTPNSAGMPWTMQLASGLGYALPIPVLLVAFSALFGKRTPTARRNCFIIGAVITVGIGTLMLVAPASV